MIVVADTSPLNYLLLIGKIDLLPRLFQKVLIPQVVLDELTAEDTPLVVRGWLLQIPSWLEVHPQEETNDERWNELDPGERGAIQLALATGIRGLLLDDFEGRAVATRVGLQPQGTLGILETAARSGLADLSECLNSLLATNFRISRRVRHEYYQIANDIKNQNS